MTAVERLTPKQRALLLHCVNTGAWLPGIDPVSFEDKTAAALVDAGFLTYDGGGYEPTPLGMEYWSAASQSVIARARTLVVKLRDAQSSTAWSQEEIDILCELLELFRVRS